MSRPAHIAALDEALEAALQRLTDAETALPAVLDRNLAAVDEVDAAASARADAFYAAKNCEDAIRQLGYVVLNGNQTVPKGASLLDGRSFSLADDWAAARVRAAESTVEMTQAEFDALSDYSASLPTGTTVGKRWKRRNVYQDESKGWRLGEYVEHDNPELVGIRWRNIQIVEAQP